MHLIRCILNFDKRHAESMRKPPAFNFRVSVCIRVLFRVGCRVIVRRTLYLSVFLARSDGEVYEKGEETLCDGY